MVNLGDEVIDTVSGFKGIAICNTAYLQGCNRICVQPKISKEGTLPKSATFDEPQLKVVKSKKIKRGKGKPGGAAYSQPEDKVIGER